MLYVLTRHDSRCTSGLLLLLPASMVKEPLSAPWTGFTQVPACGHISLEVSKEGICFAGAGSTALELAATVETS